MKQFEIEEIEDPLKNESLLNLFNVYDEPKLGDNYKTFSINRTINFQGIDNISRSVTQRYEVSRGDAWSSIAYKVYGTEELWWLVCKVNGIINPTVSPVEGEFINVLNPELVGSILNDIKEN